MRDARCADPGARVGGPEPAGGPDSIKPGNSVPLMQAFIEYSAAQGKPSFISYHLFGSVPEQNRRANRRTYRRVLELLGGYGFSSLPIIRRRRWDSAASPGSRRAGRRRTGRRCGVGEAHMGDDAQHSKRPPDGFVANLGS